MEPISTPRRSWNAGIWVGFLIMVAGLLTYLPFFARFPATRDIPWVNLGLFAVGAALIARGLSRAFRRPDLHRGKVFGIVLGGLGVLMAGFFTLGVFHFARHLPRSEGAPQVGQKAPDFNLLDREGRPVTLSSLLASNGGGQKTRAVLLVFYRGFW